MHDLVMHYIRQGVQDGVLPVFWDLLKTLICTYIKKSAAVASTKLFKMLTYDSSKGVKHFYTQLLCTAQDMITVPDQVSFNEQFLNALPSEIKCELVLCDQVSVDFTTKDQLWMAVLWVDHAFDSLKAISAYKGDQMPGMPHTNQKNSNFNRRTNLATPAKGASTQTSPHTPYNTQLNSTLTKH